MLHAAGDRAGLLGLVKGLAFVITQQAQTGMAERLSTWGVAQLWHRKEACHCAYHIGFVRVFLRNAAKAGQHTPRADLLLFGITQRAAQEGERTAIIA